MEVLKIDMRDKWMQSIYRKKKGCKQTDRIEKTGNYKKNTQNESIEEGSLWDNIRAKERRW